MPRVNCKRSMMKQFDMDEKSADDLINDINRLKAMAEADGLDFRSLFNDYVNTRKARVQLRKRQTIQTAAAANNFLNNVVEKLRPQFTKDGKFDVVGMYRAIFESTGKASEFGKEIRLLGEWYTNKSLKPLAATMRKHPHVLRALDANDYDTQLKIVRYVYGEFDETTQVEQWVKDWGEAFKQAQDIDLKQKNSVGIFTNKLEKRMGKTIHDASRVKLSGYPKWSQDIKRMVDMEAFTIYDPELKQIRMMNQDEVDGFLQRTYDKITGKIEAKSSVAVNPTDDFRDFVFSGNKAAKMEKARKLHFKDAKALMEYKSIYGSGDSILTDFFREMDNTGKQLAMAKNFGPKFEEGFERVTSVIKQQLSEPEAQALKDAMPSIKRQFNVVAGKRQDPGTAMEQSIFTFLNMFQEAKNLSRAIITTSTDPVFMANISNHLFGKSLIKQTFSGLGNTMGITLRDSFENLASAMKFTFKDRRELAEMAEYMGLFIHELNSTGLHRVTGEEIGNLRANMLFQETGKLSSLKKLANKAFNPKTLSRLRNKSMRMQFLPQQSHSARMFFSYITGEHLAEVRGVEFGNLRPALQRELKRSGIKELEWRFMRKHMVKDGILRRGKAQIISPTAIDDVSDEVIGKYLGTTNKSRISDFRQDIDSKLSGFLTTMAELGSPIADSRLKSVLEAFPNNSLGRLARLAFKYKTFPMAMWKTASRIRQMGGDTAFSKNKALAQLAATSTAMGMAVLMMKDLNSLKDPIHRLKNPKRFLLDGLVQSGVATFWGDFALTTAMGERNMAKDLLGPVLGGTLFEAGDVMIGKGDPFMFLSRQMPAYPYFSRYWWDKVGESLLELNDPMKAARRKQRRLRGKFRGDIAPSIFERVQGHIGD